MKKSKLQSALLGKALIEAFKLQKGEKFTVPSLFPPEEWPSFDEGIHGQLGKQFAEEIKDLSIKIFDETVTPIVYEKL